MTNHAFWSNKRVLITGHTGFKGTWLSRWLQLKSVEVAGYSLPANVRSEKYQMTKVYDGMNSFYGDVNDYEKFREALDQFRPDIIIHMAAQSLVRPSYQNPLDTFRTNIMGTINVLEAARHCSTVGAVINVTSDKCYDNSGTDLRAFKEQDAMGGFDPYSASKGCSELATQAYRHSFYKQSEKKLASVRAGNVIGGADWAEDRIIPDFVRAALKGEPLIIRSPHAVRPWQHVLDPLHGYQLLAQKLWEDQDEVYESGWNFGPDYSAVYSVKKLINLALDHWKIPVHYQPTDGQPYEASVLMLDSGKASVELGWKPKLTTENAVEWTMQWYKAGLEKKDMLAITDEQIIRYENMKGLS